MFTSQKFWVFGVNEVGEVATIIQDHVEWLSIGEVDGLLYAPDVFLVCLSLPGIHWHPRLGHGGGRMVLGGEYVAAGPCDLSILRMGGKR